MLPYTLSVRIADITTTVVSLDPSLTMKAEGAIGKFLVNGVEPEMKFQTRLANLFDLSPSGKMVFDSGSSWRLFQEDDTYTFQLQSRAIGPAPYKIAKIDKDFTMGEVLFHRPYMTSGKAIYPLEYPLDELLFINRLALGKGVEVHACGVVNSEGDGHLFLGQSRAGKTTTARLWGDEPDVTILSDDRIALRKIDGKLWMYGTPWHGEAGFSAPTRVPLKKVYFLEKGQKNELLPKGAAESIGRLIACSFPPFYNPDAVDFMLVFFEEVVKTVPCYELRFMPDKRVIGLVSGMKD